MLVVCFGYWFDFVWCVWSSVDARSQAKRLTTHSIYVLGNVCKWVDIHLDIWHVRKRIRMHCMGYQATNVKENVCACAKQNEMNGKKKQERS